MLKISDIFFSKFRLEGGIRTSASSLKKVGKRPTPTDKKFDPFSEKCGS
jgi:hypothetical protein